MGWRGCPHKEIRKKSEEAAMTEGQERVGHSGNKPEGVLVR